MCGVHISAYVCQQAQNASLKDAYKMPSSSETIINRLSLLTGP